MTTCNFDVYCENGVLKGDGLCFVQCCSTGNICDTCDKIHVDYYSQDTTAKIIIFVRYVGSYLGCTPPETEYGEWSCEEVYFPPPGTPYSGDPYLVEKRCTLETDCLCDAGSIIMEIVNSINECKPNGPSDPGPGTVTNTYEYCCIGCCKPSNGDPPFASTQSDCPRLADDQSAEWGPCGCIDGEFIDDGCNYTEPEGEKIGGCCSTSYAEFTLENDICGGLTLLEQCPNVTLGLSKLCDSNSENVTVISNFPSDCEVNYPTSISIDPSIEYIIPEPSSNCCSFTCCSVVCEKNAASLIKKRIIGNKIKLKINKAELIRRIRNKIKVRKTK